MLMWSRVQQTKLLEVRARSVQVVLTVILDLYIIKPHVAAQAILG